MRVPTARSQTRRPLLLSLSRHASYRFSPPSTFATIDGGLEMVGRSFSLAYSPISSSLPTNSITEPTSPSIASSLERPRFILKCSVRPQRHSQPPVWICSYFPRPNASLKGSSAIDENGRGVEQFLQSNSISDFMRFMQGYRDGSGNNWGAGELQTAVVSYRMNFPWSLLNPFLQVDLVSTIHIADKEYFDNLQKGLGLYDCFLYEMVASRENLENRRSSGSTKSLNNSRFRSFNILGFIQRQMARILALDFQLDCLNYQADNWLHADLDFETFKMLKLENGESSFTFARDMTLKSTRPFVQSILIPDDLDPWRWKLLRVSRVLPMPHWPFLFYRHLAREAILPTKIYINEFQRQNFLTSLHLLT